MNNFNFKTIDTASFIAGIAQEKLMSRLREHGMPNLEDDLKSLEFTIPVSFYDLPTELKMNKEVSDWEFISTVVAEMLEGRSNTLHKNFRCIVHGNRSSSAVMFRFMFTRKETVKKLTVAEVEELLGYKVEIVS